MAMAAILLQNMAVTIPGILRPSLAFSNQIYYFVMSASAMYSSSQAKVAIDFCFLE
jgi:hypothetical protein